MLQSISVYELLACDHSCVILGVRPSVRLCGNTHTHTQSQPEKLEQLRYYFLLRAVLNILVRNASPRGPICVRCLIFSLSGPCEFVFLLCFIAS